VSVFWILILTLALAFLQAAYFTRVNLKKVEYTRRFTRRTVFEGEHVGMVEVIRNRKLSPVPWVRAESRLSPYLKFRGAKNEERSINADRYHRSIFYMGPYSQVTRSHDIQCMMRGHYEAGSVALTSGDLFSIFTTSRQLNMPCSLDVFPRLLSEDELNTPSTRWQGDLIVKRWIMPDPFLTSGIRGYQAGDPLRDVHWRATARMGSLQVKVRDYTADPKMFVVLNVQNTEEQWGDLMEYERAGIEQGLRIAATLCVRALKAGVEAGFASNGCLYNEKDAGKPVIVPARSSYDQSETILSTMARLDLHREFSFPRFLDLINDVRDTDILILSVYDSEAIQNRMAELRARGNSVSLMLLDIPR